MAPIPQASFKVIWLRFQRVLPVQGDWEHEYKLTLGLGWTSLCVVAGFIAGVSLTSRVAWLKRLLTPHPEMRQEVERAAKAAFDRFRVGQATRGTGILLYVSLVERMVCVLGDQPIGAKLDQEIWDKIHGTIVEGIRGGRPAQAFCEAIADCGALLGEHFPRQTGDGHKLSNELRIVD